MQENEMKKEWTAPSLVELSIEDETEGAVGPNFDEVDNSDS